MIIAIYVCMSREDQKKKGYVIGVKRKYFESFAKRVL